MGTGKNKITATMGKEIKGSGGGLMSTGSIVERRTDAIRSWDSVCLDKENWSGSAAYHWCLFEGILCYSFSFRWRVVLFTGFQLPSAFTAAKLCLLSNTL